MNRLSKEEQRYHELKSRVLSATAPLVGETPPDRSERIRRLLGSYEQFCAHYFPHYCTAPFAWFHRKGAKAVVDDPNYFGAWEFPREHAKSVHADIMLPLYLKARGELTGQVIASANSDKATGLLLDVQAELEGNQRYTQDFGRQVSVGDWAEGNFTTADGVGFWGFGRGESPRGLRKAEKRPNYCVVDDIDDAQIVKNEQRVREAVDWVLGDLYGAMAIKGSRFLAVGNRIHAKGILAHICGDVDEGQPVKEGVQRLRVYALENPKTHKEDQSERGVPAWKERYSRAELETKFQRMGYRVAQREYFHTHIVEGTIFKNEWIQYDDLPKQFDYVVTYNDPSFKDTKRNDFKAIVTVGKLGLKYYLIDVWVRQATTDAMCRAHYDLSERLPPDWNVSHYFEANFIQDMHYQAYQKEGEKRGYLMPIRKDERKKPDKQGRIESLTVLFERDLVKISKKLKGSPDLQAFLDQLLGFPNSHDDAPDAFEGAVWLLNQKTKLAVPMTFGGSRRNAHW